MGESRDLILDELSKAPRAQADLRKLLVDGGLMPQPTFYRRMKKLRDEKRIEQFSDGRLALAVSLEQRLEKLLQPEFAKPDGLRDPELLLTRFLPLVGRDPMNPENREVFFQVYARLAPTQENSAASLSGVLKDRRLGRKNLGRIEAGVRDRETERTASVPGPVVNDSYNVNRSFNRTYVKQVQEVQPPPPYDPNEGPRNAALIGVFGSDTVPWSKQEHSMVTLTRTLARQQEEVCRKMGHDESGGEWCRRCGTRLA